MTGRAYSSSSVSLARFDVGGAALCGVHVADRGSLDLAMGRVHDCAIGACVQVDGFDLERLRADVRYEDNGTSLQASTLPVPEPLTEVPGG